jgi:hypothetical protein
MMRASNRLFAVAAFASFAAGCASFKRIPDELAQIVTGRWAAPSAQAARALIDEYGLPDDITPGKLTWNDHGSWKRTVVFNRKPVYRSAADMDVIEQTVDYALTPAQAAEMLAFSDSLTIDLSKGELSSRSDRESANSLNLNLAVEVARGLKTVPEAKIARARIQELEASGKSSPYTTGLLFAPTR